VAPAGANSNKYGVETWCTVGGNDQHHGRNANAGAVKRFTRAAIAMAALFVQQRLLRRAILLDLKRPTVLCV
jgi:hypothetical protein